MAETKSQGTRAPTEAAPKAITTRRRRRAGTRAATRTETAVARTTEPSGQVFQSVEDAQTAAIEAVHNFVETVESLPVEIAEELFDLLGHLARTEYDALRGIMHSVVDVDVNVDVNVDLLSKGVHVDVLSQGVNVDVLSRKGRKRKGT
jgi:hypothetical protein